MEQHLSPLELDEVAAGLTPPPAHLDRCTACRTAVDELTAANAALLETPEAKRRLAALTAASSSASASLRLVDSPQVRPAHSQWRRVVPLVAPLAAGLTLFFAWQGERLSDGARLKGAPAVMLLDQSDQAVLRATPGQKLALAVGSGGYSHAAVFAIGQDGSAETLWPKDGATYGALPPGARSRLIELVVTPGDVTVKAVFANEARRLTRDGDQVRTVRLLVQ